MVSWHAQTSQLESCPVYSLEIMSLIGAEIHTDQDLFVGTDFVTIFTHFTMCKL